MPSPSALPATDPFKGKPLVTALLLGEPGPHRADSLTAELHSHLRLASRGAPKEAPLLPPPHAALYVG